MIFSMTRAVVDGKIQEDIWIEVLNGIITGIGHGENVLSEKTYSGTLIPGFVDMHSHGAGGYYFADSDPTHVQIAINTHRSHGTTSILASLVTTDLVTLASQIKSLSPLVKSGALVGIHLEGPYLSTAKCGAHDPALLRTPHLDEIKSLIEIGQGSIRMVTIAPELDGALIAIQWLVSQGVIAAIGHSDADADTARMAIDAGAKVVTHFTNAMSKSITNTSMATQVLNDSRVALELINDGTHVPSETISAMKANAGQRIVLVTDAMSAAGLSDGAYIIGKLDVLVENSIARLVGSGALAGSTLTMDRAFINFIEKDGFSLPDAVFAAATLPAQILGLNDVGSIKVGKKANLLNFDGKSVELLTF
jgi:N-acetylglucosamine-6-phosphate deacetylase